MYNLEEDTWERFSLSFIFAIESILLAGFIRVSDKKCQSPLNELKEMLA